MGDIDYEFAPEELLIISLKCHHKERSNEIKAMLKSVMDAHKAIIDTIKTNKFLLQF